MVRLLDIISNGDGTYLRLEDLITLQELALISEKGLNDFGLPFVISGCVVENVAPYKTISAGLVLLNGKIHTLPATVLPTGDFVTQKYICYLSDTDSDSRPIYSSGTANRSENLVAQITDTPPLSGEYIYVTVSDPARRFKDVVALKSYVDATILPIKTLEIETLTLESAWGVVDVLPKVVKNHLGQVSIRAGVTFNVLGGSMLITTLPTSFRPNEQRLFTVACTNGALSPSIIQAIVKILPNGEVSLFISSPAISVGSLVYLDNISFYVGL